MHPNSSAQRRVVVTGISAVTPLGLTIEESWKNALDGKSGVGRISLFDLSDCPVQIAAEVRGFDVTAPLGPFRPEPVKPEREVTQAASAKDSRRFGRFAHLGIYAGLQAYADSGLDAHRASIAPERIGVNFGVGMGGLPEIEAVHREFREKGYRRITPFFITQVIPNLVGGQLSILLDLQGPNLCNVTACASSAHAIGEAFEQIRRGDADVLISGGAESVISELGIGGFAAMRALSTRNDAPQTASRPWERHRDGFVMGEGAAALVLEEYEFARSRGARIYGEILGYAATADASHITSPAPEGEGGRRSMALALARAGLAPEDIGYVNAHGTSTPVGDIEEARAIHRVFAAGGLSGLHVSSTKSMTGHLLGAAGAVELLFSLLAIRDGAVPPTINLEELDPACRELGLDFTAHRAVQKKLRYALSNSFGFGGTNASIVVGAL
jgi:3-oxoacyl-[acyl-carrier-protein] synthase II